MSVYAQPGSSSGSVYAQNGSSGGSAYAKSGSSGSGGGHQHGVLGFVHDVGKVIGGGGHWVAKKSDLAAHDIKSIPGGLFKITGDAIHSNWLTAPGGWHGLLQQYEHPLRPVKGDKLAADVQGAVKASGTALAHPLRDPFATALTVLPLATAGAGAAARVGYAADAAKAGQVGDAVKALASPLRKPPVAPRLVKTGDATVPLHASNNAAWRLIQAGYDHVIQNALTGKPESRLAVHANRRVEGSLKDAGRRADAMRQTQPAAIGRLAGGAKRGKLGVPKQVAQAALRLTTINRPADLARDYHLEQAVKGGADAADHTGWAKTFAAVHSLGVLTKDAAGNTVIDAARYPRLAALDKEIARGQDKVDEIAAKHGLATPEQLKAGRDNPGRVYSGAKYEAPTPAKLGVKSQAHLKAEARVTRLQALHDRAVAASQDAGHAALGPNDALIGTKIVGPGATKLSSAAGAVNETAVRLAQLEKEHNAALDQVAAAKYGPIDRAEVRRRTAGNKKAARQESGLTRSGKRSGASGAKAVRRRSVKEERRALVEQEIHDALARNPNEPALRLWAARTAEIDRLRGLQNPDLGEAAKGVVTGPGRVIPAAGAARAEKLGSALSVAKDELERIAAAHEARIKPTGFVGGHAGLPGRGYTTYATRQPKASSSPMTGARGPVVGRIKNPLNRKTFTGAGIEHGQIPDNVVRLNRQHLHAMLRYVTGDEFRRAVAQTGSPVRRSSRDVLVRLPDGPAEKLPAEIENLLGKTHSTVGEMDAHTAAVREGLRPWIESLIPDVVHKFAADKSTPIGADANEAAGARGLSAPGGYRWVDENLIRSLAHQATQKTRVGRGVDTTNSAVTAATVYFKVGHILTRTLTNATANVLQGSARPLEITRSYRLWKQLPLQDRLRALAASGGHGVEALPHEGNNWVGRTASWGASQWARRIDAPFRFNSIAYEARNAGFTTPAQFRDLLNKLEDPHGSNMSAAERSKVMGVGNRANREAIAYDRLSDFEKTYLARGFWFYPWTKAAVTFTGHTLIEHPYKAGALGAAGVQGREQQAKQIGPVPDYEGGLISLGGGKTTDFSTFSPFATSADVLDAVARPGELSGFLNPAYGAALTAGTGVNQYGGKTKTPLGDAASQLFSPTPEAQILSSAMHPSGPGRMFHKTPLSQLLRALAGPALPRSTNIPAVNSAAARQLSGR